MSTAWPWFLHWIPACAGMTIRGAGIMKRFVVPGTKKSRHSEHRAAFVRSPLARYSGPCLRHPERRPGIQVSFVNPNVVRHTRMPTAGGWTLVVPDTGRP